MMAHFKKNYFTLPDLFNLSPIFISLKKIIYTMLTDKSFSIIQTENTVAQNDTSYSESLKVGLSFSVS